MTAYEYTVLPAPDRGEKAKGAKTPADRFALALTEELNRMGADGWEYVRAETLPTEERSGLTSRTTVYHNVLVFRRVIEPAAAVTSAAPFSRPMRATATEAQAQPAVASAEPATVDDAEARGEKV